MSKSKTENKDLAASQLMRLVRWLLAFFGIVVFIGSFRITGRRWNEFSFTHLPIHGAIIIGIGWYVIEFANAKKYKATSYSLKHVTGRVSYFPFSEEDIMKAT
ncbi:MAG TPA: hypothetical protein VLA13_07685 [Massilibacterium sp.]|nr:hypothetical protein [Massilibacterium sp.]